MMKHKLFVKLFTCLFFITINLFYAQDAEFVIELPSLSSKDIVFAQFMQEIETSYRWIAKGEFVPVSFYNYKVQKDETLIHIAARCNLPYEQIALLNGIESINTDISERTILIPNAPGIFIPEKPVTAIGTLVKKRLYTNELYMCYNINNSFYWYDSKERLTPTERAFFLDTSLRMPLDESVLTSNFGMRTSPITGNPKFHKGIDLAAPRGTNVYACKSAVVANASWDNVYGNFVILDHENNTQSVYAHMDETLVKTGEIINGGTVIGKVGTTGASTGPHLHFEIRVNGTAQDPRRLLPEF